MKERVFIGLVLLISAGWITIGFSQPAGDILELKLRDWQPYTARKFFLKYQDRIMFGTDTTPRRDAYRMYYRFLETDDEYFDCASGHQGQGFWMIYGIFLPKDVLEKIYRTNAERIFFDGPAAKVLRIRRTEDFDVNGAGDAPAWGKTSWEPLNLRNSDGRQYKTRVKMLYSETGLYVLMEAEEGLGLGTGRVRFSRVREVRYSNFRVEF